MTQLEKFSNAHLKKMVAMEHTGNPVFVVMAHVAHRELQRRRYGVKKPSTLGVVKPCADCNSEATIALVGLYGGTPGKTTVLCDECFMRVVMCFAFEYEGDVDEPKDIFVESIYEMVQ
jgi:hypothetical protein